MVQQQLSHTKAGCSMAQKKSSLSLREKEHGLAVWKVPSKNSVLVRFFYYAHRCGTWPNPLSLVEESTRVFVYVAAFFPCSEVKMNANTEIECLDTTGMGNLERPEMR